MNQILNFEDGKKNRKKMTSGSLIDIKKIAIVFAIILIIFGIGIIVSSLYNTYGKKDETTETLSKPTISLTSNDETGKIDVVIQNNNKYAIDKIVYSWNDEDEVEVDGNNRNYINLSIDIPSGTNTLKIKAVDIRNVSVEYEKEYTREEAVITLTQGNGGVNISVSSAKEISYIKYQWNESTEEKIEVNSDEFETTIKVPEGENTLTVVAVDENGTETTEQTKIQGIVDEKPTINVSIDTENFIITAYDDEEIEKVIIRANGEDTTIEVGDTDFEYKVPFIDGYNEIKVKVYNKNGLTNTKKATLNK
jgi:flagellar basal body-associated protein FliL